MTQAPAGDLFARQRLLDWWDQDLIERSHVLVLGAGAVGNEVVKNLALAGVRRISCFDFDTVSPSNASRCVFFGRDTLREPAPFKVDAIGEALRRLPHDLEYVGRSDDLVKMVDTDIDEAVRLARSAGVIVAALDNWPAKLAANQLSFLAGVPLVVVGMEAFEGGVFVAIPPEGACLECLLPPDAREAEMRRAYSCTRTDPTLENVPIATNIAMNAIVSGAAAVQVFLLLHGRGQDPRGAGWPAGVPKPLAGARWDIFGAACSSNLLEMPVERHCQVHRTIQLTRRASARGTVAP